MSSHGLAAGFADLSCVTKTMYEWTGSRLREMNLNGRIPGMFLIPLPGMLSQARNSSSGFEEPPVSLYSCPSR